MNRGGCHASARVVCCAHGSGCANPEKRDVLIWYSEKAGDQQREECGEEYCMPDA
jgi:hypothetical protein